MNKEGLPNIWKGYVSDHFCSMESRAIDIMTLQQLGTVIWRQRDGHANKGRDIQSMDIPKETLLRSRRKVRKHSLGQEDTNYIHR